MEADTNYQALFAQHGGIMRTRELTDAGVSYRNLKKLIDDGLVEKVKYGYYQWQDEKSYTEVSAIAFLFPEGIICGESALLYYDYTDRNPQKWHIAVDNRSARNKFKTENSEIKPHFVSPERLEIGVTEGEIDGIPVRIYDRERVICDCLRHINTMDGEIFNTAVTRYVRDKEKDADRLMAYARQLGVEKKARRIIGIWL